ncbi:MAG: hypothetical protein RLZZ416_699 [Candidatus Parcubacteria bacterium]|jgi:hypothetical protein
MITPDKRILMARLKRTINDSVDRAFARFEEEDAQSATLKSISSLLNAQIASMLAANLQIVEPLEIEANWWAWRLTIRFPDGQCMRIAQRVPSGYEGLA